MWIQKILWWHLSPPILGEAKQNLGSYNYHKNTQQYIAVPLPHFILIQPTRMQLRYRSQSQTGKSKRSTCHPWWFGEHTEEWRCHPLAHHLGSCPGCCTWDCRNLRTIPALGRLPHRIRSQSLGCRSGWGWLPQPPATCNNNGGERCRKSMHISWKFCFKDKMREDFTGYTNPKKHRLQLM